MFSAQFFSVPLMLVLWAIVSLCSRLSHLSVHMYARLCMCASRLRNSWLACSLLVVFCSKLFCRMTNYELLRWLVEMPSRDVDQYRMINASRSTEYHSMKWYVVTVYHFVEWYTSVLWRCWLGGRKGIRPLKNWVVGCWHGYLSGARCRLAHGPADATATHCLLLHKNPDWCYLSGTGSPG